MRALLISMAILALAAAGCAGSTGTAASSGAPLTAEQYTEFERLARAQIVVERLQEEGRDRKSVATASRACADLRGGDALLTAVADVCDESVDSVSSMLDLEKEGCHGRACARMAQEMAATIDDVIATARRGDQDIAELVGDEACQEALSTPPEAYEAFRLFSEAFGHLSGAFGAEKEGNLKLGMAKLKKGEARFDDVPSAREILVRFRNACSS